MGGILGGFNLPPGLRGYVAAEQQGQQRQMQELGMLAQMASLQGAAQDRDARAQMQPLQLEQLRGTIEANKLKTDQAAALQRARGELFSQQSPVSGVLGQGAAQVGVGPTVGNAPPAGGMLSQQAIQRYLAAGGDAKEIDSIQNLGPRGKVKDIDISNFTPESVAQYFATNDMGALKSRDKLHFADNGGSIQGVNPFTGASVGPGINKVVTPDARFSDNRIRSEGALNRGVTMRGQNMTDARSRETIAQGKALTEVQGKATGFSLRMQDANKIVSQLESGKGADGKPNNFDPAAISTQWAGQTGMAAPLNYLASDNSQSYEQAKRNWVTANLRLESGAAIPDAELAQEYRKWFPIIGDGAAVIKQKAEARKVAERSMEVQSGPGVARAAAAPQRRSSDSLSPQEADELKQLRERLNR